MEETPNRKWRWPVSPGVMIVVLVSALIVIAAGLTLVVTNNGKAEAKSEVPTTSIDMVVDASKVGTALVDDAFGISLEARVLTQPEFSDGNFVQYLKTLGPGVLRMGGNSADRLFWTSRAEQVPNWASGPLTPADIDRLASVVEQAGWNAILTVNLKEFDPDRAADEVAYVKSKLGSRLRAVAIGNEPNVYYKEANNFFTDFVKYVDRIRVAAPDVAFIGPEAASSASNGEWVKDFVELESLRKPRDIVAMSQHSYPQSVCNDRKTDISSLLKGSTYTTEKKVADDLVALSARVGVAAMISETNSVSCGGQEGVSDVYAASLWAISHGLAQSAEGVSGVYFHGSIAECESKPPYNYYTPFCASTKHDLELGKLRAQPIYYGLLATSRMGEGNFVSVSNGNWQNIHAFAVEQTKGDQLRLMLINVTSPSTNGATGVQLTIKGASYSSAKSYQLISKGRSLDDRKDITFAGHRVEGDGTFEDPPATSEKFDGTTLDVVVPAGSAKLVVLSPVVGTDQPVVGADQPASNATSATSDR